MDKVDADATNLWSCLNRNVQLRGQTRHRGGPLHHCPCWHYFVVTVATKTPIKSKAFTSCHDLEYSMLLTSEKSYSTLTVLVKWPEGLMYTVTEWLTLHSITSTIQIRPSFCHINIFFTTTICLTSIPPCCVAPAAWPPRRGRGAGDTPQTSGTVVVPRCMCIAMPPGVAPSWPSSSSPRSCPSVQMRRGTNLYMHAFECIWMVHHSK